MSTAVEEILKLTYVLDEHIDLGRFDDAAALFAEGTLSVEDTAMSVAGSAALAGLLSRTLRRHDGTCATVHCTTNAIVDVDENAGHATSRAYFTVFQATPALPLQPVLGGIYLDEFRRTAGGWAFMSRSVRVRFRGELSQHVLGATTG